MSTTNKVFYVAARGEEFWNKIEAKTLRGAKIIASRMYAKATGGRFDVAVKSEYGYETVAYWSGESWSWINAQ